MNYKFKSASNTEGLDEGKQTKQCDCCFVDVKEPRLMGGGKKYKQESGGENTWGSGLFTVSKTRKLYLLFLFRNIINTHCKISDKEKKKDLISYKTKITRLNKFTQIELYSILYAILPFL